MPRNITVTFDDGSTHVYQNAPDDVTPDAVSARAAQEFGKPVKALDGGRGSAPKPAAPKPAPVLQPAGAKRAWDQGSAILESMLAKGNFSEDEKRRKRDAFFNDPRIRRLRETSAMPAQAQPDHKVRFDSRVAAQKARTRADDNASVTGNFLTSLKSGIGRGAFGLPERIAAKAQHAFGETGGLSEEEILEQVRANTDAEGDKSMLGNFLGQVLSGGLMGGAAAKSVGAIPGVATAVAAAPKAAKVAGLVAGGAAGGGLQAAGEGSDVATGTAVGAVAGPVVLGLGKGLGFLTRPLADVLPYLKPSADKILRRLTKAKMPDIERAAEEFRQRTGAEPTLFEILPLADRNRLRSRVLGSSPETAERVASAVQDRAANIGPEMESVRGVNAVRSRAENAGPSMRNTVRQATADGRTTAVDNMEQQLADARGGVTDISDRDLAEASTRGRLPMSDYVRAVDDTIMEPVRNVPAARDVRSLFPVTLERNEETGDILEVYSDPELNNAIQNAAGSLRLRAPEGSDSADIAGLTANDIANILRNLSRKKPGDDGYGAAQRAIPHVLDILEERAPTARASIERMRAAHAANKRQLEGMEEGAMTRTRDTAPLQNEQAVRNAYDTPEGTTGRFLGQANAVGQDFAGPNGSALRAVQKLAGSDEMQQALIGNLGEVPARKIIQAAQSRRSVGELRDLVNGLNGTVKDALRTVENLAESGQTRAALAENLGDAGAARITDAATVQQRSARALAGLNVESKADADTASGADLGKMILALNPHSMPTTKLFALSRITQLMHIPQAKANAIVDMLFSQDPTVTNRAIGLLNSAGRQGQAFLADLGKTLNYGARAGQGGNMVMEPGDVDMPSVIPEAAAAEMPEGEEIPGQVEPGNIDLHSRPVVNNPDGSISTVRSITVGFDDGTYLIPTVVNGKVVSNEEAIAHFKKTHEHLGKFADEASANAYAEKLHEDQATEYGADAGPPVDPDLPYGRAVIEGLFPEAHVTSDHRGPDNPLYDPNSGHAGDSTVDVRPIPGMTYQEFLQSIREAGYEIVKSYDESKRPADPKKASAWGPHWHVQIA